MRTYPSDSKSSRLLCSIPRWLYRDAYRGVPVRLLFSRYLDEKIGDWPTEYALEWRDSDTVCWVRSREEKRHSHPSLAQQRSYQAWCPDEWNISDAHIGLVESFLEQAYRPFSTRTGDYSNKRDLRGWDPINPLPSHYNFLLCCNSVQMGFQPHHW